MLHLTKIVALKGTNKGAIEILPYMIFYKTLYPQKFILNEIVQGTNKT